MKIKKLNINLIFVLSSFLIISFTSKTLLSSLSTFMNILYVPIFLVAMYTDGILKKVVKDMGNIAIIYLLSSYHVLPITVDLGVYYKQYQSYYVTCILLIKL